MTGLPPDLVDKVFQPFVQGQEAAHGPNPGTGIGLTLVDHYVRLHGGRVTAANRAEGGTRITVRLPTTRAAVPEGTGVPEEDSRRMSLLESVRAASDPGAVPGRERAGERSPQR